MQQIQSHDESVLQVSLANVAVQSAADTAFMMYGTNVNRENESNSNGQEKENNLKGEQTSDTKPAPLKATEPISSPALLLQRKETDATLVAAQQKLERYASVQVCPIVVSKLIEQGQRNRFVRARFYFGHFRTGRIPVRAQAVRQ